MNDFFHKLRIVDYEKVTLQTYYNLNKTHDHCLEYHQSYVMNMINSIIIYVTHPICVIIDHNILIAISITKVQKLEQIVLICECRTRFIYKCKKICQNIH